MRERFRPIATNLTPVHVVGIPGLALVCIAVALAMQFPEARWLIAASLVGGAAMAALLIARRRRHADDDDDRFSHGVLMISRRGYGDARRSGSSEPSRSRGHRDSWGRPVRRWLDPLPPLTWAGANR